MGKISTVVKKVKLSDLTEEQKNINLRETSLNREIGKKLKDINAVTLKSIGLKNDKLVVSAIVEDMSFYDFESESVNFTSCNGELESFKCSCGPNRQTPCRHIVAVCEEIKNPEGLNRFINDPVGLKAYEDEQDRGKIAKLEDELSEMKYQDSKNFFKSNFNEDKSLNLDKIFENNKVKEQKIQREEINIVPVIEFVKTGGKDIESNRCIVSFRVGSSKQVIVKNLLEFYQASLTGDVLPISSKVAIEVKRENFTNPQLYDFMIMAGKMKKKNLINDISLPRFETVGTVVLQGEFMDEFFEIIKGTKVYKKGALSGNMLSITLAERPIQYKLSKKDLNIEFTTFQDLDFAVKKGIIKKQGTTHSFMYDDHTYTASFPDEIVLTTDIAPENIEYVFTRKYIYVIENNEIKRITLDNNEIIEYFFKYKEFYIDKKDYTKYATLMFPKLKNLTNTIHGEGFEKVKAYPLNVEMQIDDNQDNGIDLELNFVYGDYKFPVLKPSIDTRKLRKTMKVPESTEKLNNYLNKDVDKSIVRDYEEEQKVIEQIFKSKFKISGNLFVLSGEEDIYNFLAYDIKEYMKKYEVMATERFLKRKVEKPQLKKVGLSVSNGLLKLDLSSLNFDPSELQGVLEKYREKKKFYRLKDGNFLDLAEPEQLEALDELVTNLDLNLSKVKEDEISVQKNRAMYIDALLEKSNISTTKDKEVVEILDNFENVENIKLDEKYEKVLRPYQNFGVSWLKSLEKFNFGGILADDMGLGKSLQVISLLSTTQGKSIIVCPSTLVLNWIEEMQKWRSDKKVLNISGTISERKEKINSINDYDVVITSYDLLKRDIDLYEPYEFKYIIADEAQYFKNLKTKVAKCVKQLKGENRFALTGTPIENTVAELWSIFDFVMPGYLYNYSTFKKKFEKPIVMDNDEEQLKRLKKLISPFILRRIKEEVLTELPDKNISVIKNEMTEEQRKIYNAYFVQTQKEVAKVLSEEGFERSKFKILSLLVKLRQICNHPSLFLKDYEGGSGKLEQCMDLINDAVEGNHKILLFSSYPSVFPYIQEKLQEEGLKYYTLTGSTKINERVAMVNDFNEKDDVNVFLISLKAGGTGLNLTSADVVIHFDPWWNLSAENQATDRAYRIGQKNAVSVYKLITQNTIEEKINKLQERKASLSENILNTEQKLVSKMSKEELLDLFN